jgi:hypothetical protein
MIRKFGAGVLGLLLVIQAGCIAISAKEVHNGMRYDAVATADGRLYIVDKEKRTAREVRILVGSEHAE